MPPNGRSMAIVLCVPLPVKVPASRSAGPTFLKKRASGIPTANGMTSVRESPALACAGRNRTMIHVVTSLQCHATTHLPSPAIFKRCRMLSFSHCASKIAAAGGLRCQVVAEYPPCPLHRLSRFDSLFRSHMGTITGPCISPSWRANRAILRRQHGQDRQRRVFKAGIRYTTM